MITYRETNAFPGKEFLARQSSESIRRRFFCMVNDWPKFDTEEIIVVAEEGGEVLGVVDTIIVDDVSYFGIIVDESHKGRGIGRELMGELERVSQERGARVLSSEVLAVNRPMLRLAESMGYRVMHTEDPQYMEVEKKLDAA